MRFLYLTAAFLLLSFMSSWGQNLVPNPSFEIMDTCPHTGSTIHNYGGSTTVTGWYSAGITPDHFNSCNTAAQGVPGNFAGYQPARTGNGYVGGHFFIMQVPAASNSFTYRDAREYITAKLNSPLVAGHTYYASFWVSLAERYTRYFIDHLGAYFGGTGYPPSSNSPMAWLTPQVVNTPGNYLTDTAGWTQISGTFTATGGEEFIVIGNFKQETNQQYTVNPVNGTTSAYFYVDDVCLYDISDIAFTHDTLICDREFDLSLRGNPAFERFEWSTGDSALSIRAGEAGKYWVRSYSECGWVTDTFLIRHTPVPLFTVGNDTAICDGSPLTLTAPDFPGLSGAWENGSTDHARTITASGRYSFTLRNGVCSDSAAISVSIQDFRQDLGPDREICRKTPEDIRLSARVPPGASVLWSTGSREPAVTVRDSGTYRVTVSDFLCSVSDSMQVRTKICDCIFEVPTAFTPNGDGRNDVFRPVIEPTCTAEQFEMNIYNRFGQRVFSGGDATAGWDGLFSGTPAEAGTYFFEFRFSLTETGQKIYRKGDFNLIR